MDTPSKGRDRARVHVLIPAAGRGVRFGSDKNKLFAMLAGEPVIAHTVRRFRGIADSVTIIGRSDEKEQLMAACGGGGAILFCEGGETRQESVWRGLMSLDAEADDIVLVHDGARPLVPTHVIRRCIAETATHNGAIAAFPVSETVHRGAPDNLISETVDRVGLWAAQTPQASTFEKMRHAFKSADADGFFGTDEASILRQYGMTPAIVRGARENIKITDTADVEFAEHWLANSRIQPMVRVGFGYDIHRLTPGRRLVLGGVEIPHDKGLLGHSDADVVLHALCDALLGAAALPDIGNLFPNTDSEYAGISSLRLLQKVVALLRNEHFSVGNVDCCVIAEQPKISPYAAKMRERIAVVLGLEESSVSIKATTNEGIGALGAGEGIACHATATVVRRA